jgi:C-terminal processing protease CtpA/Prc
VAVLLDQATASSGEAVAIALKGRPRTRFFGEKTFGIASANQDLPLSDGVTLYVAIALLRDAAGRTYPTGIAPDETVAAGESDPRNPDDAVTEVAKAWLADQPRCGRIEIDSRSH